MPLRPRLAASLVSLILLGLPTPAARALHDASWDQPAGLLRRGEYTAADRLYGQLAEHLGPDAAPRALLLQARAAQADGRASDAEAVLQRVLTDYSGWTGEPVAWMALVNARRAAGDCRAALRALDAYEAAVGRSADPLGPYTSLQRAQCLAELGDWPGELGAAQRALATDGGGPRLTRIEAYERAAEAAQKLGRKEDALDSYNHALALAGTRGYTAEMLFTTASVARALGQEHQRLAVERFRAVVVDYPETARAPDALEALNDMGLGGVVSPYQAGLVRLRAGDEATAASLFEQVEPSGADAGPAHVSHASSLLRLGRLDEAVHELEATADSYPDQAGAALLRLGQALQRDGSYARAESAYARMAQVAPDRSPEALFSVGLTRYLRGDVSGALTAWRQGLASGGNMPSLLRAQLSVWKAKALDRLGQDADEMQAALQQAAVAAPDTYYGLRAQELLNGGLAAANVGRRLPTLGLGAVELAERADWLAGLGTSSEAVAADVASEPGLVRADALLEVGLRAEASWETEAIMKRYAEAKDVAHLSALADWLASRDLPHLALQTARVERDLVGLDHLPRAVQKQVYPAAWGDLVLEMAERYGVDPLLLLALVRQESSFDPRAQSNAQARGLTQIVPGTARDIARRLGRADAFELRDLYKPGVSLEFGAWFLSRLLVDHQGRVFPALAAYDAGGGNVARWLSRWGDDPDVLVEEVPFDETQTYLRTVYANYLEYQRLYGTN